MKNQLFSFIILSNLFLFSGVYLNAFPDDATSDQVQSLPQPPNPSDKFKLDESYKDNLCFTRTPLFFINELDIHNITYNTNVSSHFPYTFVPFGGFDAMINNDSHQDTRGIDFGFLFRIENLLHNQAAFTAVNSFTDVGSFLTLTGLEIYPSFIANKRLKLYNNVALYTTAPQFNILADYNAPSGAYLSKVFKKLSLDLTEYERTGFYYVGGFEARLPFKEITANTAFKLHYYYDTEELTSPYDTETYPATTNTLNQSNIIVSLIESVDYSSLTQDKALLLGHDTRATGTVNFPLLKKGYDRTPDFSVKLTNTYTRKIFKDFATKIRLMTGYNFNSRENLSGDGLIRGVARGDFTGYGYLTGNIDLLIPLVYIDLYSTADITFREKVKFLIYFSLFMDGGIAISNDSLKINDTSLDYTNTEYLINHRVYLGETDNYLSYSFTAGGGIRIYPYFLHFIVRFDVGVNILEAVLTQSSPSVSLTLSFNDVF